MIAKALRFAFPPFYDFRYPVACFQIWYEACQKLMRWIGGVAAGILTFSTSIILRDISSGNNCVTS